MRCIKDTYSRYLCYTFTTSKLSLLHRGGLLKLVYSSFFSRLCSQMSSLLMQYGSFISPLWFFESTNWIVFERFSSKNIFYEFEFQFPQWGIISYGGILKMTAWSFAWRPPSKPNNYPIISIRLSTILMMTFRWPQCSPSTWVSPTHHQFPIFRPLNQVQYFT